MAHYNLMDPAELAELGLASADRLTQYLGASLQDHIDQFEAFYVGNIALHDRIENLERTVHELKSHNAYLSGMVAGFQDANKAKEG